MDVNEALAFVAVARALSFTVASKRLGLPKATISRRVASLEKRLGVRLVQRTTRAVSLTEIGKVYYERCAAAVAMLDDADRVAASANESAAGTLQVSAPVDFARDCLGPWLPELRKKVPDLRLVVDISSRQVDLFAEGIDVAIRAGVLNDSGLIARKLGPSSLILCASTEYLARRGIPKTVAELGGHDCVAMGRDLTDPGFRLMGPKGPVDVRIQAWLAANELGFLRTAIVAGLGIGFVEPTMVSAELQAGSLVRVLPQYALEGAGLFAIYPSAQQLSKKVRAFVDFLAEKVTALQRPGPTSRRRTPKA